MGGPDQTDRVPVTLVGIVMQVAPDSAEAWMRLGSCRFQLEQYGPAVPPLRRAVHLLSLANSPSAEPVLQDSLWLLIQVPLKL